MSVKAKGARAALAFVTETTWGTTPNSPTMNELRMTTESLNHIRDTLESAELRSDRNYAGTLLGMKRIQGNIDVQVGDYHDTLWENVLFDTFSTVSIASVVSISSNTFIFAGDQTDGTFAGETFNVTGSTGNDGNYTVSSISYDGTRTSIVANETVPSSTVDGYARQKILTNGIEQQFLTIEKKFLDIHRFERMTGIVLGGFSLDQSANAIGTVSFNNIMGKTSTAATDSLGGPTDYVIDEGLAVSASSTSFDIGSGSTTVVVGDTFMVYPSTGSASDDPISDLVYEVTNVSGSTITYSPANDVELADGSKLHFNRPSTVVSSNDPMTSFDGALLIDGSVVAVLTQFTIDSNNNLEAAEVVGSNTIDGVIENRNRFTGTISAYLQNFQLFNSFLNETATTILMRLTNGTTTYSFYLPHVQYSGAERNKSGDSAIIQNVPFFAEYDSTVDASIRITKTPVS